MRQILAPLMVLTIALGPGCEKKSPPRTDALRLDAVFPTNAAPAPRDPDAPEQIQTASPAVRRQVGTARQEIQTGNYLGAAARLRQLELSGKLSGPQLQAVHETTVIIQQRLAERAATGDPAAKRAWEDYQKSLTR